MTEKAYISQIKHIRKHISEGRLDMADQMLAKMYAYKPVRLLWYVAKAEYILRAEQNPEAALNFLEGKYFPGADYPGMNACVRFRMKAFRQMGLELDAVREEYHYHRVCGRQDGRLEAALDEALEIMAEDTENRESLQNLGDAYYQTSDMVSYMIVRSLQIRLGFLPESNQTEWFYKNLNFEYLAMILRSKTPSTFVLVMDQYVGRSLEVLGALLHLLGHRVFLLSVPFLFETEESLDLADTLAVSLDNLEHYADICMIPPVALLREGAAYGDNREYIIDHICRQESDGDYAVLLCSGVLLDELARAKALAGRIGRLSAYESDFQEKQLQFGWVGSYVSYLSSIYGYDVRADIEAAAEVDFSILVPARNSARTLRYTLETCLRQQYKGCYEIVVSDNSVEGSTEVYDLCRELNDPRIRYVKTPFSLTLARSFEFGYLKTRGAFVFSIGSDDGVFPWALESLKKIIDSFPDEDIIQWERGFYAWPGFNGGQENMLQIPRQYEKGRISVYFQETSEIFDRIAKDQQFIYSMPLLYINSGFRRRYLRTMLEKAGKLFDGCCQDVQTGIINCCINKQILNIIYPITIAGMNSGSMGYIESSIIRNETKPNQMRKYIYQWSNLGVWVPDNRARMLPYIGVDACVLYFTLSKASAEGLLPEEAADQILNWTTAVSRICKSILPLREKYDMWIHYIQFSAAKLGKAQLEWFRSWIGQLLSPRCIDEYALKQQQAEKCYQEGRDANGGEVLDASNYGIKNIAEATAFLAERSGLL